METFGPWKLIKAGFWIGIGFIIPSIGVYLLGTYMIFSAPALWDGTAMEGSDEVMEEFMSERDKAEQVKVVEYRESAYGKQLLILGTIENTGESRVSSIQLEAELLDQAGQMVFECSEYISKKLAQGERENFQIKCGCSEQGVPEYKSVSVRVVQASNF